MLERYEPRTSHVQLNKSVSEEFFVTEKLTNLIETEGKDLVALQVTIKQDLEELEQAQQETSAYRVAMEQAEKEQRFSSRTAETLERQLLELSVDSNSDLAEDMRRAASTFHSQANSLAGTVEDYDALISASTRKVNDLAKKEQEAELRIQHFLQFCDLCTKMGQTAQRWVANVMECAIATGKKSARKSTATFAEETLVKESDETSVKESDETGTAAGKKTPARYGKTPAKRSSSIADIVEEPESDGPEAEQELAKETPAASHNAQCHATLEALNVDQVDNHRCVALSYVCHKTIVYVLQTA
ncbi:hypothetical protein KVT40_009256 [Elsinoe batatas]|uniref:Uncharacterized protein n=1 Tax=Elsinoe batatas TaxID=2601811 RepID=A0A8K0KSC6_9PEZI|nr:hypothetical protein KVT40_009256 [Elsinoe batatas]